jgi:hypothetical protein
MLTARLNIEQTICLEFSSLMSRYHEKRNDVFPDLTFTVILAYPILYIISSVVDTP